MRHIITSKNIDKDLVQDIFSKAVKIKKGKYKNDILKGKIMATLFYEPSTRTRLSFESAMLKLGGSFISTENAKEFSSAAKGETLEDTIRIINHYCDVIVLRHNKPGGSKLASQFSKVPIINAGDGNGEHPTQALLDLFTIFSKIKNQSFSITMAGDLTNYRSVNSLVYLLALYPKVKIIFISPKPLAIKTPFKIYLNKYKINFSESEKFEDGLSSDVIYITRIPIEYLSSSDYKKYSGKYILNNKTLEKVNKNSFIMHPLPRVNEIAPEVDSDPRAIYFEQAQNGLYVRMAILLHLFDKDI